MRHIMCPECGARVRRNRLASHRATVHARPRKRHGHLALPLAAAAILLVGLTASLLIYMYRPAGEEGPEVEPANDPSAVSVQFNTEDGWTLRGTFYRGNTSSPIVILVHGVDEDRTAFKPLVEDLRHKQYNVLAYDSRGHGLSLVHNGTTRKWTTFSDADFQAMAGDITAAKYYAISTFVTAPRVAVVGGSIGANEALAFAARTYAPENKALVLLAPGDDYRGLLSAPSIQALNQQPGRPAIMFCAAQDDGSGAPAATKSLYDNYTGNKAFETIAGPRHGTQLLSDPPFLAKVVDFLDKNA